VTQLADAYREHQRQLAAQHLPTRARPSQAVDVMRERRDPTAATLPGPTTRWTAPGAPMVAEWSAAEAIRLAFYSNVIVYRCMQILADTIAGCPFRAGDTPPSEPGAPTKHNPSARLAQLLGPPPGGPTPNLTARRLWAWTVVQRKMTGLHGWEIETSGRGPNGEVTALWPLVSADLHAIPSQGGVSWFSAFEYGEDPNSRKPRRLRPDQVLYGWNPSATDFRQPESCLQAARLDISVAVMMSRYNVAFLRNDARPAAVVVTEAFESDEAFYAFKSQWRGRFGGPDNAGNIAFVETNDDPDDMNRTKPSEALNVAVLGLSQRDAMFIEQERASLERVAMACGVPWSRLSATDRTFNNAGQEDVNFWTDTIWPLVQDLADEVNIQLAPRLGNEVGWFDLSHVQVFKPQRTTMAIDPIGAYKNKIATRNEARDFIELPPVDGGDEFITDDELLALQPMPAARDAAVEIAELVKALLPAQRALPAAEEREVIVAETGELRTYAHSHFHAHANGVIHRHLHRHPSDVPVHSDFPEGIVHAHAHDAASQPGTPTPLPPPPVETRVAQDSEQRRAIIWRSTNATVLTHEKQWRKAMRTLFGRQRKAVLSRLEGNRGRRVVEHRAESDEVFDPEFWAQETADAAEPLYSGVAASALSRLADRLGIAFDIEAPDVQEFIQARANQLAGQVTDTTYQAIKDALAAGTEAGESIQQIAQRVSDVFDQADAVRAETIARTEVGAAYGASTRLGVSTAPDDVVGGMQWIATRDGRTRDDHADADGQVITTDGFFDVGGEQLAYPGDPSGSPENVVNCRCVTAVLTPDEMPDEQQSATPGEVRIPLSVALAALEVGTDAEELRALVAA